MYFINNSHHSSANHILVNIVLFFSIGLALSDIVQYDEIGSYSITHSCCTIVYMITISVRDAFKKKTKKTEMWDIVPKGGRGSNRIPNFSHSSNGT